MNLHLYIKKFLLSVLVAFCIFLPDFFGISAEAAQADPTSDTVFSGITAGTAPTGEIYEEITLRINELMVKNHSGIIDEDGQRGDWVELYNYGGKTVELSGLALADDKDSRWFFKEGVIAPGEYLLVFADNKDRQGAVPHTDFALSEDETLELVDRQNNIVDSVRCALGAADISLAIDGEGNFVPCAYPSPDHENSGAGYDAAQDELVCTSPLQINEVVVYNDSTDMYIVPEGCDWIELKNVSGDKVELSDYSISDDHREPEKFRLPSRKLKPGERIILVCGNKTKSKHIELPFKLNSDREGLYLSCGGELADCVFLRDIPHGCSFGRLPGRNGFFFFDVPSPMNENTGGFRRISAVPTALTGDGVFNNVSAIVTELEAPGIIYYTTDGSMPTAASSVYQGEITMHETGVLRAVCVEPGCMPSAALTQSFIINENHTLPVVSLALDDPGLFDYVYKSAKKDVELSGNLAFYEESGRFSIPCGVELHGESSLSLKKKNLSLRFRDAYGQAALEYELFDGGVARFSSLLLRAGQTQSEAVFVSEFIENLALQFSDKLLSQRSRYCILYVDGEYYGIYALMEKVDKYYYANHFGVSEDSVTVLKAPVEASSDFAVEVLEFSRKNDLTDDTVYDEFCRRVDIDSLIDWLIIEGFSQNTDLNPGNVRYCHSTEDDGKWRHMLYDLDAVLHDPDLAYKNVFGQISAPFSSFVQPLMKNERFRQTFLTRASQVYRDVLTQENVLKEFDRLTAVLESEIERDFTENGLKVSAWQDSVKIRRRLFTDNDWCDECKDAICRYLAVERGDFFDLS